MEDSAKLGSDMSAMACLRGAIPTGIAFSLEITSSMRSSDCWCSDNVPGVSSNGNK